MFNEPVWKRKDLNRKTKQGQSLQYVLPSIAVTTLQYGNETYTEQSKESAINIDNRNECLETNSK